MLYEKLDQEMQWTVDEFAGRLRPLSWESRTNLLERTASPFAECFTGREASLATQGFLTAVLERLVPLEIDDPLGAYLLSLSLNPEHRALADAYLEEHPDAWLLLAPTEGGRFIN
ncbi:MAG: hypothetical protein U0002_11055 [Thermoanaerobaculia bacterium]